MPFDKRWTIEGELTTTTPLHIGNGGVIVRQIPEERVRKGKKAGEQVEISSVTTSGKGPYVPGSSLKGVMRAWARACHIANFTELFGVEDKGNSEGVGGKAEFWDAFTLRCDGMIKPPPYWCDCRLTGIATSVAINRRTKTASEKKLFHVEFVPPGVTFGVTVSGDFTNDEVDDLLFLFEGFNNGPQAVALGARTGDGWGQLIWELTSIRRLEAADVPAWIANGGRRIGYAALNVIPPAELEVFRKRSQVRAAAPSPPDCLTLNMTLEFKTQFLVNDPEQTGPAEEGKSAHMPLLDADGRILLPASSIRGAIRSQAEKILRTLGSELTACYPDGNGPHIVYGTGELKGLCLACQVFGAPGWRSPVQFSDFKTEVPPGNDAFMQQEFVAIDRFTGGSADAEGLKFNAKAAHNPILTGCIKVDLRALEIAGAGPWALGLLTLTLRDLMEGDIRFGFGAAKGYGAAQARIDSISLPEWSDCPGVFKEGVDEEQWQSIQTSKPLADVLQDPMGYWVLELEEAVRKEGGQ